MSNSKKIMKKLLFIKKEIEQEVSQKDAERIWLDAEKRLEKMLPLYASRPTGVKEHTEKFIFPTAAIYLALKDENPKIAYQVLEKAMKRKASHLGDILRLLGKIPGFSKLFIKMWNPVIRLKYGEKSGFQNQFYPKKRDEYRMDILFCPYCKYLTELGCPELTVLFCKNDVYTYGNMDKVDFLRTQTLGSGGEKCDFYLVYRK